MADNLNFDTLLARLDGAAASKRVDRQGFDAALLEEAAGAIRELKLSRAALLGPPRPGKKAA